MGFRETPRKLHERFGWNSLRARNRLYLRGTRSLVRAGFGAAAGASQLADAGVDAPRREARNILLNYARRLEVQEMAARREIAAGLNELSPIMNRCGRINFRKT